MMSKRAILKELCNCLNISPCGYMLNHKPFTAHIKKNVVRNLKVFHSEPPKKEPNLNFCIYYTTLFEGTQQKLYCGIAQTTGSAVVQNATAIIVI